MAQVATSLGLPLGGLEPLPEALEPGDVVMVAGCEDAARHYARPEAARVVSWLRRLPAGVRVASVCSGALLLGRAGCFDGRAWTTHHSLVERLRREAPRAKVEEDRIFVEDGPVFSAVPGGRPDVPSAVPGGRPGMLSQIDAALAAAPPGPQPADGDAIRLPRDELLAAIEQVRPAVAPPMHHSTTLTGVLLRLDGSRLVLVGTDTHRLVERRLDGVKSAAETAIVPSAVPVAIAPAVSSRASRAVSRIFP